MATARTTAHLTRVEARLAAARRIRAGCRVRTECLAEALRFDRSDGVWGGLDPAELNAPRAGTALGAGLTSHALAPRVEQLSGRVPVVFAHDGNGPRNQHASWAP